MICTDHKILIIIFAIIITIFIISGSDSFEYFVGLFVWCTCTRIYVLQLTVFLPISRGSGILLYMVASKIYRNHIISGKYKTVNHLSHISFKTVLLATVHFWQWLYRWWKHSWKTFLWRLFSSSFAFIMIAAASQKRRPFSACFSRGNRWNSTEGRPESMGDAPVLSHCCSLRNPWWPKPTGVLEHCREIETNCWFPIFGSASSCMQS